MKPLGEIYGENFFLRRVSHSHSLAWRAPAVCEGINELYAPKTLIDVGCGSGDFVAYFLDKLGVDAYGLEGTENCLKSLLFPSGRLFLRDLRFPLLGLRKFDVVLSLEVAEHIEPEYADVFVENLIQLSDVVIMTAAPPNQGGHYHVNCQPHEYWTERFLKHDFILQTKKMDWLKKKWVGLMRRKETRIYVVNLMIFERKK